MIRVLLPLAVVAAILFGPLANGESTSVGGITKPAQVTGFDYVGPTIECWQKKNFSIKDGCAPEGGANGKAMLAAVAAGGAAGVLGILGLLPFVGRLTSVVTTLAGGVIVAAVGYFAVSLMGADKEAVETVGWGAYLAGGGGLLTFISGLSGMRGK